MIQEFIHGLQDFHFLQNALITDRGLKSASVPSG